MKKNVFSVLTLVLFTVISFATEKEVHKRMPFDPSCEEAMFDAMEWALEEGFDDQTVSYIGNWTYANCWLRQNSELNPSF
ncbi:hypothetical protein [Flavobacterium sp. J27]|uniref:hypothetical protein n=1 Tax=Flavobacterium sp. J27 TaxID=2060419 RepID=UPI00102F99F0|nr:hypothetical protein [Flavobacterium sp. J27]